MSSYILNQSTLALPRALLECSFPHLCPALGNLQLHVAGHTGHLPPLAALEGRVQLPENWSGGSPWEASVNCTAKALGPSSRLSRLPTWPEFQLPIVPTVPNLGRVSQCFRSTADANPGPHQPLLGSSPARLLPQHFVLFRGVGVGGQGRVF